MADISQPNDHDIPITFPEPQPSHHPLTDSPDVLQNAGPPSSLGRPPNFPQPSQPHHRVSFTGSVTNHSPGNADVRPESPRPISITIDASAQHPEQINGGPQFQTYSHPQHSGTQHPPRLQIDLDGRSYVLRSTLVTSPSDIDNGPQHTHPRPEPLSGHRSQVYPVRDVHDVTADGFRTIVIVGTLFTGIQAQILSASLESNDTIPEQLVNAFWFAGMMLDVFGVVFSILASRWFELLNEEEVKILKKEWEQPSRAPLTRNGRPHRRSSLGKFWPTRRRFHRSTFIAMALFAGFPTVVLGVCSFLVGLLIYIWNKQPLLVAIMSTVPVPILGALVAVCFTTHGEMKKDIIVALAEKRGEW